MLKLLCCLAVAILGIVKCGDEQRRYRYPEYDRIYPQYMYHPYSYDLYGPDNCNDDCNRRYYPIYAQYLIYFRRRWKEQDYPTFRASRNVTMKWKSYGNYEMNGKVKAKKPKKKGHCCWEFKQIPQRTPVIDYQKDRQRIEYRQLSVAQRASLHAAWNAMKASGVYDYFTAQHNGANAPSAHGGSAFLCWHREYLFRMENALIDFGYTGPGLPYYDSTLDQALPTPAHSAIWTPGYLGNNNGFVTTGFASLWSSIPACSFWPTLFRQAAQGPDGNCLLMSDFDVNYVYSKRCYRDIVCQNDCKFENDHAGVHSFVGGHMNDPACAPSDPTFYLHHAFIDCVWETFRKNHQMSNKYKEYPNPLNGDDIGPAGHAFNANMEPFLPLLNANGLDKFYEDYYKCKRRPMECDDHSDCGSPLLWCNDGRCMAKVRNGGNCAGLTSDACYCQQGTPQCLLNICSCEAIIAGPP